MKVIVTGIKPYLARLHDPWAGQSGRRFDTFAPIRTKREFMIASNYNGNTGNYFIGEAAIEAVGRASANYVEFGPLARNLKDRDCWERLHKDFGCIVLVTANMLRSDYDAGLEADLISAINLPVVVMGIGCQRLGDLSARLPQGTIRFIDALRSREHAIFTRGAASAQYLIAQGLRNVWATGCPSMFLRPENVVTALKRLKALDWSTNLNVVFSGYLGRDITAASEIAAFSGPSSKRTYVLQDEHLFHGLEIKAGDDDLVYNDQSGRLEGQYAFRGREGMADMPLHIFFNTHQWRAFVAAHDVSFGKRFHGVVAGLQAGTPGLAIAIDDRMREMLDHFGLPYIEAAHWREQSDKRKAVQQIINRFDVERFSDAYLAQERAFSERLTSIGFR